jgi:hypothetical protein
VRRILGRLILLGAAAGAAYALRSYLKGSAGPKKSDVQIVLDNGATVEPDPAEAQEFTDIARKILEIGG